MTDDTFYAERLTQRCWRGRQSIEYEAIWLLGDRRMVRVRIDRDSHDFQSSAQAHFWNGAEWTDLASIPFPLMATLATSAGGRKEPEPRFFEEDEQELIRLAGLVLFPLSAGPNL